MEEFIGGLWHRFITRAATRSHPEAVVRLADMERSAGILFRALGGDAGLRVAPAAEVEHGARRNWLARLAHAGEKVAQAARDEETLRLPAEIALFPERSLNRDLYLWLIAQGAALPAGGLSADTWIAANQQASAATLEAFPGFAARYRRLVAAVLAEPASAAARRVTASTRCRTSASCPRPLLMYSWTSSSTIKVGGIAPPPTYWSTFRNSVIVSSVDSARASGGNWLRRALRTSAPLEAKLGSAARMALASKVLRLYSLSSSAKSPPLSSTCARTVSKCPLPASHRAT